MKNARDDGERGAVPHGHDEISGSQRALLLTANSSREFHDARGGYHKYSGKKYPKWVNCSYMLCGDNG